MIILDTNVISALMRAPPDEAVVGWLDRQPPESIWTTAITVFEIRLGIALLAAGRRRDRLEATFERSLAEDLEGRVLPFDGGAAHAAADIAARRQAGRFARHADRRHRRSTTRHCSDAQSQAFPGTRVRSRRSLDRRGRRLSRKAELGRELRCV